MSLLMLRLAAWQFERLDERKLYVKQLSSELAGAGTPVDTADDLTGLTEYRKVVVRGQVSVENWVFVRNVLRDGVRGFQQLVPLRLADGTTVVVNAGFLTEDYGNDLQPQPSQPRVVSIVGVTREAQKTKGNVGGTQPFGSGTVPTMSAVDPARLQQFAGGAVAPLWIQQLEPRAEVPLTLPPPDLTEGPHFSYALQWVAFTLIITVGYSVLLYRVAREGSVRQ